jgi:hypothetical protein
MPTPRPDRRRCDTPSGARPSSPPSGYRMVDLDDPVRAQRHEERSAHATLTRCDRVCPPNSTLPLIMRPSTVLRVATTRTNGLEVQIDVGLRAGDPRDPRRIAARVPAVSTSRDRLRRSINGGSGDSVAALSATGCRDRRRLRGRTMYATTPANSVKRIATTPDSTGVPRLYSSADYAISSGFEFRVASTVHASTTSERARRRPHPRV